MKHQTQLLALGLAALGSGLAACGGGEECGNGVVEGTEQCDDNNHDETDFCRLCEAYLPPRTTVKWRFNAGAADGFTEDGCGDLHVSRVQVALDGPDSITLDDVCSNRQIPFTDLTPGGYTASVTPLDSDGNSLVTAPATMEFTALATDSEATIVIPWDAWIGPYTGSFFFTVHWGGVDCSAALPEGVDTQVVTLTVNGTVVSQSTTTGEPLDGSAPVACVPASNPSPISALSVPFGPATIQIVGRSAGVESFRSTFDTFVGAGPSNPTLDYDVQTVYDAGPPDAAPPDA